MKAYKDIYYKYITFAMVGAVTIGILAGLTKINRIALVVAMIVWLLGNAGFWQWMAIRRKKSLEKLLGECKLAEYVDSYEALDQRFPRFGDLLSKNDIKLNLAAGLYAHGEFSEMKRVLDTVQLRNATDLRDLVQKVAYLNDLALYYIERGQYGEAEAELSEVYPMFDYVKFKEPKRSECLDVTERTYATLQIKRGNFDGLDKQFINWVRDVEDPLAKVACSYRLGELYYNHGMTEEANKQFEFVVKYGGDTFYAERAADALNVKGSHKAKL